MKIIRSNPWGNGIHSPYLYGFVTKVLYGRDDSIPGSNNTCPGINKQDIKRAKMITRMISFFQPAKVVFIGEDGLLRKMISESGIAGRVCYFPDPDQVHLEFRDEFVIWERFDGVFPEFPDDPENSAWIFSNIKSQKMRYIMDYLRNSEKVSVTLEVNRSGIVIFNKNLQKENFVIHRCFFY